MVKLLGGSIRPWYRSGRRESALMPPARHSGTYKFFRWPRSWMSRLGKDSKRDRQYEATTSLVVLGQNKRDREQGRFTAVLMLLGDQSSLVLSHRDDQGD